MTKAIKCSIVVSKRGSNSLNHWISSVFRSFKQEVIKLSFESRLSELGIVLPDAPAPAAMYVPVCQTGSLLFVSGQIPTADGRAQFTGKAGKERSLEEAQQAARLCGINMLAAVRSCLGSLDRVRQVVKLQAFVSSDPSFTQQHLVTNAVSELLFQVFGEAGMHARTAVGVPSLPMDVTVEVEAVFEVE